PPRPHPPPPPPHHRAQPPPAHHDHPYGHTHLPQRQDLGSQDLCQLIISNTSSGSIYHSLMEIYGLNSKYDGDFTKLWGSAKDLRFKILDELEYILKGRKREK
ncbi:MAG: hypothetical protein QW140_02250, partial [Candidatus Aenigmatarchaeota archaeon]